MVPTGCSVPVPIPYNRTTHRSHDNQERGQPLLLRGTGAPLSHSPCPASQERHGVLGMRPCTCTCGRTRHALLSEEDAASQLRYHTRPHDRTICNRNATTILSSARDTQLSPVPPASLPTRACAGPPPWASSSALSYGGLSLAYLSQSTDVVNCRRSARSALCASGARAPMANEC